MVSLASEAPSAVPGGRRGTALARTSGGVAMAVSRVPRMPLQPKEVPGDQYIEAFCQKVSKATGRSAQELFSLYRFMWRVL